MNEEKDHPKDREQTPLPPPPPPDDIESSRETPRPPAEIESSHHAPPVSESTPRECSKAGLACHLVALLGGVGWIFGFVVPGLCAIGPLIALTIWGNEHEEVGFHANQALKFNTICSFLSIPIVLLAIPFPLLGWLAGLGWFALVLLACAKVVQGQRWRYPVPIPWPDPSEEETA